MFITRALKCRALGAIMQIGSLACFVRSGGYKVNVVYFSDQEQASMGIKNRFK